MRLLLIFISLVSFYACHYNTSAEKEKFANVYMAGCDSVFYCVGEKLDPRNLKGSKKNDSVFINTLLKDISSKNVLLKPLGGSCGGVMETTTNFVGLFKDHQLNYSIAHTDSLEEKYFNDHSFIEVMKQIMNPPNLIYAKQNNSTLNSKSVLFISYEKKNKIHYEYRDSANESKFSGIIPATEEQISQLITNLKVKNIVPIEKLAVILKAEDNTPIGSIVKLQKAFRKNGIQKISLQTTSEQ